MRSSGEVLRNKHLSRVPRVDHPSNNSSNRNSDSEAYIDDSDIAIDRAPRRVEDSDIEVKGESDTTRKSQKKIPRVGSEDPGPNGRNLENIPCSSDLCISSTFELLSM